MAITIEEVRHIAKLARLELGDAQLDTSLEELNRILSYVASLTDAEQKSGKELPALASDAASFALRDDIVSRSSVGEAVISQAPERFEQFFKLPRVVDS